MSVKTTLRVRKLFFESIPMFTSFDELQITHVNFEYEKNTGGKQITHTAKGAASSDYVSAEVELLQNTPYKTRAIVYSNQHPEGIASAWIEFETDDVTIYYSYAVYIKDNVTNEAVLDAVFVLNVGTGSEQTKNSRIDGLVWFQRLQAGTHTWNISKAGLYASDNGTIVLPGISGIGIPVLKINPL